MRATPGLLHDRCSKQEAGSALSVWLDGEQLVRAATSMTQLDFCVGFLPHIVSASDIYSCIYLFIYLSTDRSARHVVSSLGVST